MNIFMNEIKVFVDGIRPSGKFYTLEEAEAYKEAIENSFHDVYVDIITPEHPKYDEL